MYRWAVLLVAFGVSVTACSSAAPTRIITHTRTQTLTATSSVDPSPVAAGPTTARSGPCPFVSTRTAAAAVGMRLARTELVLTGGRPSGCRFFALQHSPLHRSEHLPGPHQPAIAITSTRYRSSAAARDALVRLARAGTNPQRAAIGGHEGACFQQAFYPPDRGRDWACAFAHATTLVLVRTVVTSPAVTVVEVARVIASKL